MNVIGIVNVLKQIKTLNKSLRRKCNSNYSLSFKRYKYRKIGESEYSEYSNYDFMLCLNYRNRCVSSVSGKLHEPDKIELISKTEPEFEGKKFNLYLRTAFIYLMYFLRPVIHTVSSVSVNPISTYVMYKHFGASNNEINDYVRNHGLTPDTIKLEHAREIHKNYNEKNKRTIDDIYKELDELEESGEDLEEYGWSSREEAIEFLMNDNNVEHALIIDVNLRDKNEEDWLNKLDTIEIKCEESQSKTNKTTTTRKRKRKQRSTSTSSTQ